MVAGSLKFDFPLPRVHTGVHLANGRLGALVWGVDKLHITLARAGFWDRRGGRDLGSPLSYHQLKSALLEGREEEVRLAFRLAEGPIQQMGGGRLELDFGLAPVSAELFLDAGLLQVSLADGSWVSVVLDPAHDALSIRPGGGAELLGWRLRPAWEWTGKSLAKIGFSPPIEFSCPAGRGWRQDSPGDSALWLAAVADQGEIRAGAWLDLDSPASAFSLASRAEFDMAAIRSAADWSEFWTRIPPLAYPDPLVQEMLLYGLWKLHAMTHPEGVPATLQGPWMEEHRIPLWSNDYHLNINLQMIYTPCLELGLHDHLMPLWRMIHEWIPRLQAYGEAFFGAEGALMLPHAVDDRGNPVGSYWQGTVDHVSLAWTGLMAWKAAQDSGSAWLARETAWPLLQGAFEGFSAMVEEDGTGGLRLPISVSPEFGEGAVGTWGANSSFALAAIHSLCRAMPEAAAAAGMPLNPAWAEMDSKLPNFSHSAVPWGHYDDPTQPQRRRICLWDGQDLTESHRHHSHLAGIYPFAGSIDLSEPEAFQALLHWVRLGGGQWCAWSTVWAVCILARAGWHDAAECWLRFMVHSTMNEGKSLSGAAARGVQEGWGSAQQARVHAAEGDHEVMQLDANLGVISAALEVIRAKRAAGAGGAWADAAPNWLLDNLGIVAQRAPSPAPARSADEAV